MTNQNLYMFFFDNECQSIKIEVMILACLILYLNHFSSFKNLLLTLSVSFFLFYLSYRLAIIFLKVFMGYTFLPEIVFCRKTKFLCITFPFRSAFAHSILCSFVGFLIFWACFFFIHFPTFLSLSIFHWFKDSIRFGSRTLN